MKLNEIVLKDMFSNPPTRDNFRFIFLVENEALEDQILTAGYFAVGITDEGQKTAFLRIVEDCQFSWMKDFYFIPSSKFGLMGEVKKQLESFGYIVLSDGWKIFKDKVDLFLINREELELALGTYIENVSRSAGGSQKPQPEAISAAALMSMDISPISWLVDGMIPPGLDLLIGASKIGKSWMALQMCIAIASGEPFMGRKTKKTKVLYLSLEDSYRRIQNRMKRQLQGKLAPDNLYFMTNANLLGAGLLEQIDPYVKDGVEVIVIDTLQKIRGANGNKNAYAADYEDMSILKRYADENDISIIPVHHTRKMKDDDVFNMVSGTNGIMGAADTTIILQKDKRADTKATMHITGRDVLTDELAVDFNRDTCTWENLGSKEDLDKQMEDFNYRHDPIVETIKEILENYSGWQGTATEFQNEMMNRHKGYMETRSIGKRFRELKQWLYEKDNIIYEEPSGKHEARRHKFKRDELLIK